MPARRRTTAVVAWEAHGCAIINDIQGSWLVQAWIELQHGEPWITELRLRPARGSDLEVDARDNAPHDWERPVPPGGITSSVLRSLKTSALYDAIDLRDLTITGDPEMLAGTPGSLLLAGQTVASDTSFLELRRTGRRGRDDRFYAEWAERYVTKCAETKRPYPELEREHPGYSRTQLRGVIQEARRRGLLLGGVHGQAGGRLSAKARKVLNHSSREKTAKRRTP